jgi:hypothetical protein
MLILLSAELTLKYLYTSALGLAEDGTKRNRGLVIHILSFR